MPSGDKCRECGAVLPTNSAGGLCGKCLLGLGLEQQPQATPDATTEDVAAKMSPDALYEKRWALSVLDQTLARLQQEYAQRGKSGWFEEMKGFLPGAHGSPSRPELAARQGISVAALDVAVHRLRQRFGALLREQVAQTVSSEDEVDDEIRYLISVLGT